MSRRRWSWSGESFCAAAVATRKRAVVRSDGHLRDRRLHELELGELCAELLARRDVMHGFFDRAPGHAVCGSANARAKNAQGSQRQSQTIGRPRRATHRSGSRHDESTMRAERMMTRQRNLRELDAWRVGGNQKCADSFFATLRDLRSRTATKWCAMPTLEMSVFSPSKIQCHRLRRRAVVRIDATSLPAFGSVSAKPPIFSPADHLLRRDLFSTRQNKRIHAQALNRENRICERRVIAENSRGWCRAAPSLPPAPFKYWNKPRDARRLTDPNRVAKIFVAFEIRFLELAREHARVVAIKERGVVPRRRVKCARLHGFARNGNGAPSYVTARFSVHASNAARKSGCCMQIACVCASASIA